MTSFFGQVSAYRSNDNKLAFPVVVDPVNDKAATSSCLQITSPISCALSRDAGKTLKTPPGNPASCAS